MSGSHTNIVQQAEHHRQLNRIGPWSVGTRKHLKTHSNLGVIPLEVELVLRYRRVPYRVRQSTGGHMPRVDLDLDAAAVLSLD